MNIKIDHTDQKNSLLSQMWKPQQEHNGDPRAHVDSVTCLETGGAGSWSVCWGSVGGRRVSPVSEETAIIILQAAETLGVTDGEAFQDGKDGKPDRTTYYMKRNELAEYLPDHVKQAPERKIARTRTARAAMVFNNPQPQRRNPLTGRYLGGSRGE